MELLGVACGSGGLVSKYDPLRADDIRSERGPCVRITRRWDGSVCGLTVWLPHRQRV